VRDLILEVPSGCSVCSPLAGSSEGTTARPGLTCGLCGGVIFLPVVSVPRCQSCGEPIVKAADGVKLCDGRMVHTVCGRRLGSEPRRH